MVTVSAILFPMVVTFLVVHELDAIRQREWRFFFAPVAIPDRTAYRLFTALHAPLLVVILLSIASSAVQVGIDLFAVGHGLAHVGLRNHPLIEFDSWFSRVWIFGGSLLAGLHLLVVL